VTYSDAVWRDGFSGLGWLSRGTCLQGANVSLRYVDGYCPYGGELVHNFETGEDYPPHRFCERHFNYTYDVYLAEGTTYVRAGQVEPDMGELDDRGYSAILDRIAERNVRARAATRRHAASRHERLHGPPRLLPLHRPPRRPPATPPAARAHHQPTDRPPRRHLWPSAAPPPSHATPQRHRAAHSACSHSTSPRALTLLPCGLRRRSTRRCITRRSGASAIR
jgi:hypothetical protein